MQPAVSRRVWGRAPPGAITTTHRPRSRQPAPAPQRPNDSYGRQRRGPPPRHPLLRYISHPGHPRCRTAPPLPQGPCPPHGHTLVLLAAGEDVAQLLLRCRVQGRVGGSAFESVRVQCLKEDGTLSEAEEVLEPQADKFAGNQSGPKILPSSNANKKNPTQRGCRVVLSRSVLGHMSLLIRAGQSRPLLGAPGRPQRRCRGWAAKAVRSEGAGGSQSAGGWSAARAPGGGTPASAGAGRRAFLPARKGAQGLAAFTSAARPRREEEAAAWCQHPPLPGGPPAPSNLGPRTQRRLHGRCPSGPSAAPAPLQAQSAVTEEDRRHMQRALELAARGLGRTYPNPAVGCVIVDAAGQVVGEGYHPQVGEGSDCTAAAAACCCLPPLRQLPWQRAAGAAAARAEPGAAQRRRIERAAQRAAQRTACAAPPPAGWAAACGGVRSARGGAARGGRHRLCHPGALQPLWPHAALQPRAGGGGRGASGRGGAWPCGLGLSSLLPPSAAHAMHGVEKGLGLAAVQAHPASGGCYWGSRLLQNQGQA